MNYVLPLGMNYQVGFLTEEHNYDLFKSTKYCSATQRHEFKQTPTKMQRFMFTDKSRTSIVAINPVVKINLLIFLNEPEMNQKRETPTKNYSNLYLKKVEQNMKFKLKVVAHIQKEEEKNR